MSSRIDSIRSGLRAIAQGTPDVPVSRVILDMQGGQKGLLVNFTNICRGKHRIRAVLDAQSGARSVLRPPMRASCGK